MKTLILVYLFLGIKFSHIYGHRDGARNESCYNHTIDHGSGTVLQDCDPPSCRYLLVIKEVVNEETLQLGNETDYYECGKLYGVEVDHTLNPPEGFLVQARSGPEVSSEIIGTFLDPSVVEERDSSIPINYKILECKQHESAGPELYPNSATHPRTVNTAPSLQTFWKAPNCTEEILPNVTMWFTIVQQLKIFFNPAKHITLTYRPPPLIPTSSSAVIPLLPTRTYLQTVPLPTSSPITKQMRTNASAGSTLSRELIIGLSGGLGVGFLVLIIIVIITVVIGIKLQYESSKKKKKQPSRISMLWAAGSEPPLTSESNGKYTNSVTNSEPLTSKEHEQDSNLVNASGNAEDNSIVAVV